MTFPHGSIRRRFWDVLAVLVPAALFSLTWLLWREVMDHEHSLGIHTVRDRAESSASMVQDRLNDIIGDLERLSKNTSSGVVRSEFAESALRDLMVAHPEFVAATWKGDRGATWQLGSVAVCRELAQSSFAPVTSSTTEWDDTLVGPACLVRMPFTWRGGESGELRAAVSLSRIASVTHADSHGSFQLKLASGPRELTIGSPDKLADDSWAQTSPMVVGGNTWRLTLQPSEDEVQRFFTGMPVRLLVVGIALAILAALLIRSHSVMSQRNTGLTEANRTLLHLATRDGLTGIHNRRHFEDVLASEVDRSNRYGNCLSLIMLDVDHFKEFNDLFGHPAGDEVLKEVAQRVAAGSRTTDVVARYGGEEFVVILPETDLESARIYAERIRSKIAASPWPKRNITVSIGVAGLRRGESGSNMVEEADQALYLAKTRGRNRVQSASDLESADWKEAAAA